VDRGQRARELREEVVHVAGKAGGAAREPREQQSRNVAERSVRVRGDKVRDRDRRGREQLEHARLAFWREVGVLDFPFRACPAAQDEPVDAAVAVDHRKRVVGVPAALGQAPDGGHTAAATDRFGSPAQRLLRRPALDRMRHRASPGSG
jgi:hypothetical protein